MMLCQLLQLIYSLLHVHKKSGLLKDHFFYGANQSNLESVQKALIGWKKSDFQPLSL